MKKLFRKRESEVFDDHYGLTGFSFSPLHVILINSDGTKFSVFKHRTLFLTLLSQTSSELNSQSVPMAFALTGLFWCFCFVFFSIWRMCVCLCVCLIIQIGHEDHQLRNMLRTYCSNFHRCVYITTHPPRTDPSSSSLLQLI